MSQDDLGGLGVEPVEERLYRTLLRRGPCAVAELTADGITSTKIRRRCLAWSSSG